MMTYYAQFSSEEVQSIVDNLARQYAEANSVTYAEAMAAVLTDNQLYEAYENAITTD